MRSLKSRFSYAHTKKEKINKRDITILSDVQCISVDKNEIKRVNVFQMLPTSVRCVPNRIIIDCKKQMKEEISVEKTDVSHQCSIWQVGKLIASVLFFGCYHHLTRK